MDFGFPGFGLELGLVDFDVCTIPSSGGGFDPGTVGFNVRFGASSFEVDALGLCASGFDVGLLDTKAIGSGDTGSGVAFDVHAICFGTILIGADNADCMDLDPGGEALDDEVATPELAVIFGIRGSF